MPRIPRVRLASFSKYLVPAAAALAFIGWILITPQGMAAKLAAIGYAFCHQIPERSFHIGSYQLPLCARCSGMYLGAMTGILFQSILGRKRSKTPHWSILAVLGIFVAAFGVDGVNSYLYLLKQILPGFLPQIHNLYIPNNSLRLLTGSGTGLAIAAAIFPTFNQVIWSDLDRGQSALPGWKAFGLLVALQLVLDMLVLTGSPLVLYPLVLVSVPGVWILLTSVYTIVWVMITRQGNTFLRIRQLWLPILAGLTLTIFQTAAFDLVRFWLTRTWGGFLLG